MGHIEVQQLLPRHLSCHMSCHSSYHLRPIPQERPNPWIHHGLELFMTSCSSSLSTLRLEFMWELPFADRLIAAITRLGPALERLDVTCSNCFFTDQAVRRMIAHESQLSFLASKM